MNVSQSISSNSHHGTVTLWGSTTRGQGIISKKALLKDTLGVIEEKHRAVDLKLLSMKSVQGLLLGITSSNSDSGSWGGGGVPKVFIL